MTRWFVSDWSWIRLVLASVTGRAPAVRCIVLNGEGRAGLWIMALVQLVQFHQSEVDDEVDKEGQIRLCGAWDNGVGKMTKTSRETSPGKARVRMRDIGDTLRHRRSLASFG